MHLEVLVSVWLNHKTDMTHSHRKRDPCQLRVGK